MIPRFYQLLKALPTVRCHHAVRAALVLQVMFDCSEYEQGCNYTDYSIELSSKRTGWGEQTKLANHTLARVLVLAFLF